MLGAMQGMWFAARKRWEKAEAALLEAQERVREAHNVFDEALVLQMSGETLAAKGETERAREQLREAHDIYARLGASPYLVQTQAALGRMETQHAGG
jgi:cellobiose-specific phosphotransferase system component IIA